MQIRQLESLQAMAKTSSAKVRCGGGAGPFSTASHSPSPVQVIFVPMNFNDVNTPSAKQQMAKDSTAGTSGGMSMQDVNQISQMSNM